MLRRKIMLTGLLALVGGLLAPATSQAAFTISVNGSIIATDQGAGDEQLGTVGRVATTATGIAGYNLEIDSRNNDFTSATTGRITTSQVRALRTGGPEAEITIVIQDDNYAFPSLVAPIFFHQSATRNAAGNGGTSGTATFVTSAGGPGVGPGGALPVSTSEIELLTEPSNAITSQVFFNRTTGTYTFRQTITLDGLSVGDGTALTLTSTAFAVPAPASLVMLLAAAPVLGLARRLRRTPAAI